MTDARVVTALRAADPTSLVPARDQFRPADLAGTVDVLDLLPLGPVADEAFIAIVQVADRRLIVPGRLDGERIRRDPGVAALLAPGSNGSFTIDLPEGPLAGGSVRELDVDQTHDSVILAEEVMVKWHASPEASPAPVLMRALRGTDIAPRLRAVVTWDDPLGVTTTVLTAADYLPEATDGWTWAVDLVRSFARGEAAEPLEVFARVGDLVARMHVRFAGISRQMWGEAALRGLQQDCRADLRLAVELTDGPEGDRLRRRVRLLDDRFDELDALSATPVIPIHGDLHVGQVLRHGVDGNGLAITDFDGNPVLAPAERSHPAPAARDMAGMLASVDHVGRVVVHRTPGIDAETVTAWIPRAQEALLTAYRARLAQESAGDLLDERLLPALMVDQECREYIYAARHLPHWRYVPDAVLCHLFPDPAEEA